jgi:hypothetical protein
VARILLLFGFCSLALAQAPPQTDWRFAHPNADMKMSLNLQALLNSPSIVKAIDQAKAQAKDNAMQVELGLAMLKTVDRVSISVRQKPAVDGKAGDMDVLVQVTGAFDSQMIAGFFPSTGSSKVQVVGPHTLLIGDGDSFAQAVERMKTGAPAPAAGLEKADLEKDELEQSDIWLSASSNFLAQQGGAASPMGNLPPVFQGLQRLSVGLNLSESPEINLLLKARDANAAAEMLMIFQAGTGQLAQLNPMAGDAAKSLTMKQDGASVRLHFVVPPELVALAQQQVASAGSTQGGLPTQLAPLLGGFGRGGFAPGKPSPGAIAPEPPPQNGGKIVIYGLDDGPKVIPPK